MFLLYSLLLAIGFLAFLPRFLFQKKYAASFSERLGNLPDFDAEERPVVWLHCVSVGETQAARPLVRELLEKFPEYKLVVSTTTLAGQRLAKEIFAADAAMVFYFPFDFRFAVRRVLRKIQPAVVLLMETEIWLNFLREASRSGAKIAIVNGRLSAKSANRYGWIPKTIRRVLHHVDWALMQSAADAKRLMALGIRNTKVKVTGNVKFDQQFNETENDLTGKLGERFAVSADAPLIVAASTHAPEEKWILEAFKTVYKTAGDKLPRLMIVPRHPERFAEVAEIIKKSGFDWARRGEKPSARDKVAEIILLDSIGELRAVYPLAEFVFVGGSLIPHGGQNVLEPAAAQKAIVTGFYTTNFETIVREFLEKDALVQLPKLDEKEISAALAESFTKLLEDTRRREKLAENAFRVLQSNRGASLKTIEYLKPLFEAQSKKDFK
ncbi:MAG TPA: 3-deoxy-D-manno-octulosonic acid transferase [Pyrinomonadaceae bacterium]|jgi:3-deoxy-D-manno-octulosonic-acid transferase